MNNHYIWNRFKDLTTAEKTLFIVASPIVIPIIIAFFIVFLLLLCIFKPCEIVWDTLIGDDWNDW